MDAKLKKYKIELSCVYPEWWRYNVFIMIVGYDAQGNRLGFNDLTDRVYDADYGGELRSAPDGYDPARPIAIESDPCSYAELYTYIVANTFPGSEAIKDSPPFEIVLSISVDGKKLKQETYSVNQWGGLTISGLRIG